ncbi:MAG: amidophosphoribosyltransferase [Methanobacteriota archaeon]|nr:MAG: amidophosphoribosyltransferase [Euryarchaeota archaeon]
MARDQGTSEFSDLRPKEKCGIIGCAGTSPITSDLYYGLRILQHRGQESAGLAVYDDGLKSKRGMGLVHEVFTKEDLVELRGNSGIGHVRYSTTGSSVLDNAQPIVAKTSYGEIALAHNGDIANANEIREELSKKGWAFMTTSDSEVIVRLLANEIVNTGDVKRALREFTNRLVGAYSLALMINDSVYAIRDPLAIRPLCIGEGNDRMMIASESVVFDTLPGYRFIRDLKPGEIVELRSDGFESTRLPHPNHTAHCMFEWVYFARPDSVLDERLVYDARVKIGVVEGLIKNRYIERTFIMPEQADRETGVMLKLNAIRSAVKNKRVVLVDDSIVRGTTIRKIVGILRLAGAREVHVRIGCLPIRFPCYLGIDMKTRDQFIANEKTVPEIADFIEADSLGYLSLRGLISALKHSRDDICLGCLTGEYPVPIPGEKMRKERPLEMFSDSATKPSARKKASSSR